MPKSKLRTILLIIFIAILLVLSRTTLTLAIWKEQINAERTTALPLADANPSLKYIAFEGIATYKHTTPAISIAFIGANGISGVFGDEIMLPKDPIIEGKRFMGWFCDKECTIPFTAKTFPSYDISVYPLFQKAA